MSRDVFDCCSFNLDPPLYTTIHTHYLYRTENWKHTVQIVCVYRGGSRLKVDQQSNTSLDIISYCTMSYCKFLLHFHFTFIFISLFSAALHHFSNSFHSLPPHFYFSPFFIQQISTHFSLLFFLFILDIFRGECQHSYRRTRYLFPFRFLRCFIFFNSL